MSSLKIRCQFVNPLYDIMLNFLNFLYNFVYLLWYNVGVAEYPYIYRWRNNEKRATLYGRACRIITRMALNSALVEFDDGQREIISRNAIKRIVHKG